MFRLFLVSMVCTVTVFGQTNSSSRRTFPQWSPSVKAGSVYNFDSELSDGNSFTVNRYYIEAGLTRMWDYSRMISFSVGYGQEDYHFDQLAAAPWNNIDSYRAGVFARWALNEKWTLFAAPSVRSYIETGADLDDGLSASFFGGAGYQFGDSLFLGPAIGVFGQVEDNPMVIPIVLINWNITDRLSLGTGGGFAATAGPGVTLAYELTRQWSFGVSGRYENFRFRLSPDNSTPDGVGEDEAVSVIGTVTYELYPRTYVSAILGSKFDGEVSVFDKNGRKYSSYDTDFGIMAGLVFGLSL